MKVAKTKSKIGAETQNCAPAPQPCPSCGHCPTCGRGGARTAPYTYPYYIRPYPYWPTWVGEITVDGTAQHSTTTYELTPKLPSSTASASPPSYHYDTVAVRA